MALRDAGPQGRRIAAQPRDGGGMLILPSALRRQLLAAAKAAFPAEACGLVIGRRDGATVTVTALAPATNMSPTPRDSFAIDPAVQFSRQRAIRGSGQAVIGCYISHPNGRSEPSPRDREAGDWGGCDSGFIWIIIATGVKEAVAAFDGPSFQPLTIRVSP